MEDQIYEEAIQESSPMMVSERLRIWRESTKLSVHDVATQLAMNPRMLTAFEEGDYSVFPAYVYAAGYLKRMVDHFGISERDALMLALKTEWQEKRGGAVSAAIPTSHRQRWYVTPRRLFSSLGAVVLLFFAWILVSQLVGFTAAPSLSIEEPRRDVVIQTPITRVRGVTEKESQLTVNGREITMNEKGVFDSEIELVPGLNTLYFLAQNRFGKIIEETRYVVVK